MTDEVIFSCSVDKAQLSHIFPVLGFPLPGSWEGSAQWGSRKLRAVTKCVPRGCREEGGRRGCLVLGGEAVEPAPGRVRHRDWGEAVGMSVAATLWVPVVA